MTDMTAFLANLLTDRATPKLSNEEFFAGMLKMSDMRIQRMLDEQPLDECGWRDLEYLETLCGGHTQTPLMVETAAAIVKERADRLTAAQNGPAFAPKTYVEVIAVNKLHNRATSAPLPIGIRGRVVGMVVPENDAQVGLVQVRFPPKPLGYSGREHVNYYVPNVCLKAC